MTLFKRSFDQIEDFMSWVDSIADLAMGTAGANGFPVLQQTDQPSSSTIPSSDAPW